MSGQLVSILVALHTVAAAIWVGGMFFAWMVLRPVAVAQLEPPARVRLWEGCFVRFFPWVWASVIIVLLTGFGLIFGFYGGMAEVGGYVHTMLGLGLVMMGLFAHIYFAPFRRMRQAVSAEDWPQAGQRLGQIRKIIGINLVIGLIVLAIGSGGRFW